jgi:hypothetical protein
MTLRQKFENLANLFEIDKENFMPLVDKAIADGMTEYDFVKFAAAFAANWALEVKQ